MLPSVVVPIGPRTFRPLTIGSPVVMAAISLAAIRASLPCKTAGAPGASPVSGRARLPLAGLPLVAGTSRAGAIAVPSRAPVTSTLVSTARTIVVLATVAAPRAAIASAILATIATSRAAILATTVAALRTPVAAAISAPRTAIASAILATIAGTRTAIVTTTVATLRTPVVAAARPASRTTIIAATVTALRTPVVAATITAARTVVGSAVVSAAGGTSRLLTAARTRTVAGVAVGPPIRSPIATALGSALGVPVTARVGVRAFASGTGPVRAPRSWVSPAGPIGSPRSVAAGGGAIARSAAGPRTTTLIAIVPRRPVSVATSCRATRLLATTRLVIPSVLVCRCVAHGFSCRVGGSSPAYASCCN